MSQRSRRARAAPGLTSARGRFKLWLARYVVLWERLWPRLWPALAVLVGFATLALVDLLPELPGLLHLVVLLAAAAGLATLLARALRRFAWPSDAAARHRLETDSGLAHRPLTALDDDCASSRGDPLSKALWRAHVRRAARAMRALRLSPPAPGMARRDPRALRSTVVLVGAIGLFAAIGAGSWSEIGARLARAVSPVLERPGAHLASQLDLWIDPPPYTGAAPIFLAEAQDAERAPRTRPGGAAGPIAVPAGSALTAQVSGGDAPPVLQVLIGEVAVAEVAFETVESAAYRARAVLSGTAGTETATAPAADALAEIPSDGPVTLVVAQDGRELGRWPLSMVPDRPPTVEFVSPPARTRHAALRIEYLAEDDYGVAAVELRARLAPEATDLAGLPEALRSRELSFDLPLPSLNPTEARSAAYEDLSAHIWAGLPAELRLVARDAAGLEANSDPVVVVLPERIFNHPVARAIAEQRKRLTIAPHDAEDVAGILTDLATRPDHFFHDLVVFMGLRTAALRLADPDLGAEALEATQALMWDLALRVENGELAMAMRDLREAERALQDALANDASDEEIEALLDELQNALDQFVEALAEEMRRMAQDGEMPQLPGDQSQRVEAQDLQEMLDQIRDLARSGARDAARRMLSELQNIIENMRAGAMAELSEQARQAAEMMDQMQKLIENQQALLDETFRRAQDMANPGRQGDLQRSPSDSQRGEIPMPGQMQGEMGQTPGPQGQQAPGREGGRMQGQRGGMPGPSQQMTMDQMAGAQQMLRSALGEIARMMDELAGDIPAPLGRADQAMRSAGESLGQGRPDMAAESQSEALDQLRQGMQDMMEAMAGQQQMGMGPANGQTPGNRRQGRDPLGRPVPGSFGVDTSDVQVPEEADMQRSREILDELRRRAAERGRPTLERDYIERLLRRF